MLFAMKSLPLVVFVYLLGIGISVQFLFAQGMKSFILILDFDFFLVPHPIHQQIGLNFLIMLYTKPCNSLLPLPVFWHKPSATLGFSIEESFNIPALPVINWAARLTLLRTCRITSVLYFKLFMDFPFAHSENQMFTVICELCYMFWC